MSYCLLFTMHLSSSTHLSKSGCGYQRKMRKCAKYTDGKFAHNHWRNVAFTLSAECYREVAESLAERPRTNLSMKAICYTYEPEVTMLK